MAKKMFILCTQILYMCYKHVLFSILKLSMIVINVFLICYKFGLLAMKEMDFLHKIANLDFEKEIFQKIASF